MDIKQLLSGLGLAILLGSSTTYAGDCVTSFDQSCFHKDYNAGQVAADYERNQQEVEAQKRQQAAVDIAWEEAMREEEEELRKAEQAAREEELLELERAKLWVEEQQRREMIRQQQALQGIGAAIGHQNRELREQNQQLWELNRKLDSHQW
jgi:hypothetical protein